MYKFKTCVFVSFDYDYYLFNTKPLSKAEYINITSQNNIQ